MDKEVEKLEILGFFGICKVSINIILNYPKLFSKLTLTLILPVSYLFLANNAFSSFISSELYSDKNTFYSNQLGNTLNQNSTILAIISSERHAFWLIKLCYVTILVLFSLPSTSAIVYTVAYIYTGKETTFCKVVSIIPQLLKRLIVTFLWNVSIMFMYNFTMILLLVALTVYIPDAEGISSISFWVTIVTINVYLYGLVYISVIWQLASVITVMEKSYGIQAMMKSRKLIKGKLGIAISIFLVFNFCFLVGSDEIFVQPQEFDYIVGNMVGVHVKVDEWKIVHWFLCLVLLTCLFLLGNVVQTVIYFVCKSYHNKTIDKSCLIDHLESYLGQYVPLSSKATELEQIHAQSMEP